MSIVIREVWMENFEKELQHIRQCVRRFPIASFHTEFPGTVFNSLHLPKEAFSSLSPFQLYFHMKDLPKEAFSSLSPFQLYFHMKENVDALNLIQLGLTLSDSFGNLPTLNTSFQYVWQFNFKDFDPDRHLHNPESISFLKTQGINFLKNKEFGIDSYTFGSRFNECGLGSRSGLTWITFHGLYDYGYMIKILTRRQLPDCYGEFRRLVHHNFGLAIHDVKPMAKEVGIYGGLEKIAKSIKLDRKIGKSHQAGSDSLLIMQVYLRLKNCYPPPPLPWC